MKLIWKGGKPPDIPHIEEAQEFVDSEVLRLCDPYVPKNKGVLIESGKLNTKLGSGRVVYRTPYARRWYYTPANFQEGEKSVPKGKRGNYWFERMKNSGGKEAILRGLAKKTGGMVK